MKLESISITKLKLNPDNPRTIDTRNLNALCESILTNGWLKNIVVSKAKGREGIVLDGNQRLKAARKLVKEGYSLFKNIPVLYVDKKALKDEERIAFTLNLPRGSWDWPAISEMDFTMDDLQEVGFSEKDLLENLPQNYQEETKSTSMVREEIRYYKNIYFLLELQSVSEYEQIKEQLEAIREKGIKILSGSN